MQVLGRVSLFAGLSERQLERIDKRMVSPSWAAGDPLFSAGEPADHLYVLAEGQAKLFQPAPGGQEVVVDLLIPGDLFGALSILGQPVYPETAWALTTTCALRIDPQSFREILAEHPQVALRVLDDVAGRLAQARSEVGQQSTSTVAQRVATTLLRLADRLGQERSGNHGILLQLHLSRADLAGMVGATTESVSRVMSRLQDDTPSSGRTTITGQTGSHAPQSTDSSGWI